MILAATVFAAYVVVLIGALAAIAVVNTINGGG